MKLCLIDTSNYLYAGSYSRQYISRGMKVVEGAYCANEAPIGSVKFLLNAIFKIDPESSIIVPVFDNKPEVKADMYKRTFGTSEKYKGNRGAKPDCFSQQKQYAMDILNDMGYPVHCVEGYEADDVIYSLVKYYHDEFDEIQIYTRDSDLFFLVDYKTSIIPVISKDRMITVGNYTVNVNPREYTPYNVLHLRKLCKGDKSDCIPGVGKEFGEAFDSLITDTSQYERLGDLDYCRELITDTIMRYPLIKNAHIVMDTFNILMPLLIPEESLRSLDYHVDYSKSYYYRYNWDQNIDRWHLEDMLMEFIDKCNE